VVRDGETLAALLATLGEFVREWLMPGEALGDDTDVIPEAIVAEAPATSPILPSSGSIATCGCSGCTKERARSSSSSSRAT